MTDVLSKPKWNHGDLAIFVVLTYVLRFIETTPQPKFKASRPKGFRVMTI